MSDLASDPAVEPPAPHTASEPPAVLPAGTLTFLLTDIAGSTPRWEEFAGAMAVAVARHYAILDAAVIAHHGVRPVEQGEGDSMVAVFARAADAVACALDTQRALLEEDWPPGADLRVRMALHTGEAQLRDGRYYVGATIIRCARLRSLADGGQVLISTATADLLVDALPDGAGLLPLGSHRLKGLREPERVFQLAHPALPHEFPPLRSVDGALPNNVPAQLTSFVGREGDLAQLSALVAESPLVTLVGPGGVGKTRLAAQLAVDLAPGYPDGVWWIDLAPLTDPAVVPLAALGALGLGDARGMDPLDRIADYLQDQRALLVVDNCEHVLGAVASLLARVLSSCAGTVAVTTSREPLGVPGEVVWRVPPMTVPVEAEATVERLLESEAVQLFAERARAARPNFHVDDANAAAVAAICSRLDGVPLAIELAAARVRTLSPDRILDGLADRFRLLTGGARTAVARQQTLHASVAWSHDLLSEPERILLRRLAALAGRFTAGAAEAVAASDPLDAWEALGLLSDLVDRSLVSFDGDRYRLLQTVAEFAGERLVAAGEAEAARHRHAAHFREKAEAAAAHPARATVEVEADRDNYRRALQWMLAEGEPEAALQTLVALTPFWTVRGYFFEGLDWLRQALGQTSPEATPLRARALWAIGHLSAYGMEASGGYGFAEREQALTYARELGDTRALARLLADTGGFSVWIAPEEAVALLEEAIVAARAADDELALALASMWLAFFWVLDRDRPDLAQPALDELARLAGHFDPYWHGWHDFVTGLAASRQGRLHDARDGLSNALERALELADPVLEAYATGWLSGVHLALGDLDRAETLAGDVAARLSRSADECRQQWIELGRGQVALARGDLAAARRQLDEVSELVTVWNIPYITADYGLLGGRLAIELGDVAAARRAAEQASTIAELYASPWLRAVAHNLAGRVERSGGHDAAAEDRHHQALALAVEFGLHGVAIEALECLASLATAGESWAEAARVLGAAAALRDATGERRWPLDEAAHDAGLERLRTALGDEDCAHALTQGGELTLDAIAAYVSRSRGERKRPSSGWNALTPAELEVVALATRGLTNAQIGSKLFITAGTVKVHLSSVYRKLDVANRAALAAEASARGL